MFLCKFIWDLLFLGWRPRELLRCESVFLFAPSLTSQRREAWVSFGGVRWHLFTENLKGPKIQSIWSPHHMPPSLPVWCPSQDPGRESLEQKYSPTSYITATSAWEMVHPVVFTELQGAAQDFWCNLHEGNKAWSQFATVGFSCYMRKWGLHNHVLMRLVGELDWVLGNCLQRPLWWRYLKFAVSPHLAAESVQGDPYLALSIRRPVLGGAVGGMNMVSCLQFEHPSQSSLSLKWTTKIGAWVLWLITSLALLLFSPTPCVPAKLSCNHPWPAFQAPAFAGNVTTAFKVLTSFGLFQFSFSLQILTLLPASSLYFCYLCPNVLLDNDILQGGDPIQLTTISLAPPRIFGITVEEMSRWVSKCSWDR
jgi:hypothetical protein